MYFKETKILLNLFRFPDFIQNTKKIRASLKKTFTMSENQVTQANNTHLMSTQSNSTNPISFNNTAASENNSPPMSLFQHKQMNFDNTSSTMNLNLNGFFLPNNCANKSHLNLNELNNGNEFLYGGGSTTTRSSPLQSLCEVSSPASSGNSKTYKHTVQPNLHQNKISPSMFENEDNLGKFFQQPFWFAIKNAIY